MGELMLCNQMLAAMPYYMDEMSVHVYSLEELSYFIEKNTGLLTPSFMSAELTEWIEQELGLQELAQSLQKIMEEDASLAEFTEYLLLQAGYCSKETCKRIGERLRELESRPAYEAVKLRADWYMEKKRYRNGLYEYRKLVYMEEVQAQPVFEGNVWHNLGTAYARLMLFDEAVECYENAYRLNQDERSQQASRYAKMLYDAEVNALGLSVTESVSTAAQSFGGVVPMDELILEDGKTAVKTLEDWKSEYRQNCRL